MRKLPAIVIVALILTTAFLGCRKSQERLYPYGWTILDPTFDSLTLRLEREFLDFEPDQNIEQSLSLMKKEADADPKSPEKMARYHYWHARYHLRHTEVKEAMEEFNVALALTDSARNPYDVARIRWNMELEEPDGAERYFDALEKLELFKKFNDISMQAAYYMTLGGHMNEVGDANSAIGYFNSADSLLRLAKFENQLAGNIINRARSLDLAGKTPQAIALLKDALKDTVIQKEPIAMNIARWNLYLLNDSMPLLQEAYNGLDDDYEADVMRPLYGSQLVREYAKRGMKDSVEALIRTIEVDTAVLQHDNFIRDYLIGMGEGERALGNYPAALDYYDRAFRKMHQMEDNEVAEEIVRIEQRRQIDSTIHELKMKHKDRIVWLLVTLIVVIVIASIVIIFYRRRLNKQREDRLRASLAEEQATRKVLALELAIEENRRLGDTIRETIDALEKEGLVSPSATGTIEATLKSHDISMPAQTDFVETFSNTNPHFLEALEKKYPNLTKTDRRLAVYISLGLDNKHISRLTGVRPESVKQARWRLRSKLALPEGVSLEDAFKDLMQP